MHPETLTFVSPFPPESTGIAQSSAMLGTALENDATVARIGWRHHYPGALYRGQQTSTPRKTNDTDFSLSWFNPFSWISAGIRARRSSQVCFAWVSPFDAIPYWTIATISRRPTSAQVHNIKQHEYFPLERPLTRLLLNRMDLLVVHSASTQAEVLALMPSARTILVPLPSLVSIPDHSKPPSRHPLKLLQPGYVRRYKGADLAIGGVKVAIDAGVDCELRIVGQFWGVEASELIAQARSLGIGDRVAVEDRYLSDEELIRSLRDCNAVLAPYRSASQSGVIPISLQAGRPVIATDVGGLVEQVRNGYNAVVAPSPNVEEVGKAIVALDGAYDVLLEGAGAPQPTWDDVATAIASVTDKP